jgi:HPt (histidine-containing phosphotransfer) domain-containing protein
MQHQPTVSSQPQHPVLDPEAIARLRGLADDGSSTFLTVVVQAFMQDSKRRLADLRDAAGAADSDRLQASAHALKGAGSEVGAMRVAEICQTLEGMGGSHMTDGAGDLVIRLDQELQNVQSELKCLLAQEAT